MGNLIETKQQKILIRRWNYFIAIDYSVGIGGYFNFFFRIINIA